MKDRSVPVCSRLGLAVRRGVAVLILTSSLPGCSVYDTFFGGPSAAQGQPGFVSGFLGGVAADEPRAALVARQILSGGGNAADAATALAFALTVTLPSRAGLGGGGGCIAYNPDRKSIDGGTPEAILFTPVSLARTPAGADRPAAVPMMARGFFALQARYGHLPFEQLIAPSEELARFGINVSRSLASDLSVVAQPLLADPGARAIFGPTGQVVTEGQRLVQADLGSTLAQIRTAGVGDLYQGALAHRIAEGSQVAGGVLTTDELRGALPRASPALTLPAGHDQVAFLPPPADGGLAAAAAFQVLQSNPQDLAGAQARAMAVASQWRRGGGGDPMAVLKAQAPAGDLPTLPASTSFVTLDRNGGAVACALTMDNLFGTGRVVPGTGIVLAASPNAVPPPLLAAAIAWNSNLHAFRAAVAGSGQNSAALAVAAALQQTLATGALRPAAAPDPARANMAACSRYLPDSSGSCGWANDPRGSGLAVGSN